jgi:integrase
LPVPLTRIELGRSAAEFARRARAPATDRAYASDWRDFAAWCGAESRDALPAAPVTIGAYFSDRSGILKVSTLNRRLAAIVAAHRRAGHGLDAKHPAIALVLAGIRRTYGSAQTAKTALLTEDLRRVVRKLRPDQPGGCRDRAVLLVGFALAMRRSELVALNLEDVTINGAGLEVLIRRSKTDQEGHGRMVGAPRSRKSATCPVAALEAWLALCGWVATSATSATFATNPEGHVALFTRVDHGRITHDRLTGRAVAEIVKRAAARVGIDPTKVAGHSLRSGFATSAARGGADLSAIMQQTGHKNSDVAMRYVQKGALLKNPASKAVRL